MGQIARGIARFLATARLSCCFMVTCGRQSWPHSQLFAAR